ncbi:MAG: glycosyltransferase family 9 protein [Bdellovibrionia bacterium]
MAPAINCRYFNGYKPCGKALLCEHSCQHFSENKGSVLIVHLGALGAVVRSTALLSGIKRKYPQHRIYWLTDKPAHFLLQGHPDIHQVVTSEWQDYVSLKAISFEAIFVVDKSLQAVGLASDLKSDQWFGFKSQNGAIIPATSAAEELWSLGLSNHKKFFVNTKSEVQLMYEALELGSFCYQDYDLPLSLQESYEAQQRRNLWRETPSQWIVGINTGCSHVIPYKKLTIEYHRQLIREIKARWGNAVSIVLLGGPEDSERNNSIAQELDVIVSATQAGLRDGLVSVAACDIVLTGDSLGMHMAISQKKHVIAWFGPTCAHEIHFYGRGQALLSPVSCAPCWKRSCQKDTMCYDLLPVEEWLSALNRGINELSQSHSPDRVLG